MTKKKKISMIIISGLIIIALSLIVRVYFESGEYVRDLLIYQTNHMISHKDYNQMAKISANHETYQYLKGLSPKTRIRETSDDQGGTAHQSYYGAAIGKKNVSINMNQQSTFKWRLDLMEIN